MLMHAEVGYAYILSHETVKPVKTRTPNAPLEGAHQDRVHLCVIRASTAKLSLDLSHLVSQGPPSKASGSGDLGVSPRSMQYHTGSKHMLLA